MISKTTINVFLIIFISSTLLTSCSEYKEFDNNEVIEDTYTGNISVTSSGSDPAADFTGNGDSGTYSFAWVNTEKKASLNFDITSTTGSVQFIINDKRGNEVLNQTLTGGSAVDTYAGVTEEGKAGTWKVTMFLTNLNGDGSFSVHPGN